MIYRNWDDIHKIKDGTKLWACAYERDGAAIKKHSKPVYGVFLSSREQLFCQLTKKGTISSKRVSCYSRYYADTEAECKELYNELIKEQIKKYEEYIEACREDMIA